MCHLARSAALCDTWTSATTDEGVADGKLGGQGACCGATEGIARAGEACLQPDEDAFGKA